MVFQYTVTSIFGHCSVVWYCSVYMCQSADFFRGDNQEGIDARNEVLQMPLCLLSAFFLFLLLVVFRFLSLVLHNPLKFLEQRAGGGPSNGGYACMDGGGGTGDYPLTPSLRTVYGRIFCGHSSGKMLLQKCDQHIVINSCQFRDQGSILATRALPW